MDGTGVNAMAAALDIAQRRCWHLIRAVAGRHELSARLLGAFGDLLFLYMDHLEQQTISGYEAGTRASAESRSTTQAELLDLLLAGAPMARVRAASTEAVWPLPDRLVVVAVGGEAETDPVDLSPLRTRCLVRTAAEPSIVVCRQSDADQVMEELAHLGEEGGFWLARSWGVPPHQVRDAARWVTRAIELAEAGVITGTRIIDCRRFRTELWLHAEPALRQRMCQELLQPLLAETPNSREILSETLLVWLETRDSAPAIAGRLGVHPQTVRYRWKRINELFGEDLHDPEFIVQITMLLKASVPLWKAGDQSDFERYRAEASR